MDQSDQGPAPRRPFTPLKDRLGELCASGKESAEYLWQVPDDAEMRKKIAGNLSLIQIEVAKTGRREMAKLVEELQIAIAASPSPQQAEILQDGFDRLTRLWQSAKSGLF
jgi:hypothetical protein